MRLRYLILTGFVGLAGCNLFGGSPPAEYPSSPPVMKKAATEPVATTMPSAPTLVKVPADAIVLSSGSYPPPSFPAPTQPGLIEVIDMNGDPTVAVATTSVTGIGGDAPKQMSITDVTNMSVSLDRTHSYKIVFVPLKPGTPAP